MSSLLKWVGVGMVSVLLMMAGGLADPILADEDLAKQSQNPLATVVSVPFENNFYLGIGPSDATAYILNMKPVYPMNFGSVNLINRLILPVM